MFIAQGVSCLLLKRSMPRMCQKTHFPEGNAQRNCGGIPSVQNVSLQPLDVTHATCSLSCTCVKISGVFQYNPLSTIASQFQCIAPYKALAFSNLDNGSQFESQSTRFTTTCCQTHMFYCIYSHCIRVDWTPPHVDSQMSKGLFDHHLCGLLTSNDVMSLRRSSNV